MNYFPGVKYGPFFRSRVTGDVRAEQEWMDEWNGMHKWVKLEVDDWNGNGNDNGNGDGSGMGMGMRMEWEEMDERKVDMELNWIDNGSVRNEYVYEHPWIQWFQLIVAFWTHFPFFPSLG